MSFNKRKLISAEITEAPFQAIVEEIIALARKRTSCYVCVAAVHMVVEAYLDKAFNNILNQAIIATPDGRPVSLFMNLLYGTRQEQVPGPELMPAVMQAAMTAGISIYFYGATEEVLAKIRERCEREYPTLHIAGMLSPPFRTLSSEEDAQIVSTINASGAGIVFVALGCPKQERWMAEHQGKIQAVMLGVGAAFPFFAGTLQRAPKWIRVLYLEWLYRLICEPRRLFIRYLVTNTLFLILIMRQWIALTCSNKKAR